MQQAAAQKKGVMLEFTGSDWCGACIIAEDAGSFPSAKSRQAIGRAFIPVELDFPRKKQQDEQTRASFDSYKKSYGITGFPSLVFTDAQGQARPLRRGIRQSGTGHERHGPGGKGP